MWSVCKRHSLWVELSILSVSVHIQPISELHYILSRLEAFWWMISFYQFIVIILMEDTGSKWHWTSASAIICRKHLLRSWKIGRDKHEKEIDQKNAEDSWSEQLDKKKVNGERMHIHAYVVCLSSCHKYTVNSDTLETGHQFHQDSDI